MTRVGLPRALLFHQYGDAWESFIERLGLEPVVSSTTTGEILTSGTANTDNESCLPVKVFTGHLLKLKEATDAILIPRVVTQNRGMKSCPKYLGLPDMARAIDRDLPPIFAPVMDLADRRHRWVKDWYETALRLGAGQSAARAAVKAMLASLKSCTAPLAGAVTTTAGFEVGVAGHVYNLQDPRVSLGLLDRIRVMGASPLVVEDVPRRLIRRELKTLERKIRWDSESDIVGAVLHWSRSRSVAGVIYLSSFACGPGSMIGALIEDQFGREKSVPLMSITLDEHSGEGGLVTRIEAFLDMLRYASADDPSGAAGGAR